MNHDTYEPATGFKSSAFAKHTPSDIDFRFAQAQTYNLWNYYYTDEEQKKLKVGKYK